MEEKKEKLLTELRKYEEKLLQIRKDCNDFKAGGSRYGDEYGEIQSKVVEAQPVGQRGIKKIGFRGHG